MKVRLISKRTIVEYAKQVPESAVCCQHWLTIVKEAQWGKPEHIKQSFGDADVLGKSSERVVFNLCGNRFRLICQYKFTSHQVFLFVKWIGRHKEYDRLCALGKQYNVSDY